MKICQKRQTFMFFLVILFILQIFFLSLLGSPLGMSIPSVSASVSASSDAIWNPVQPLVVTDDVQSSFWTIMHVGTGNIRANLSDDSLNKKSGANSLKIVSENGTHRYFDIYHQYAKSQNFYMRNVFVLWWYGNNTNAKFRLHLYAPDAENKLYYDFYDNFSEWRQFILYFDTNFTIVGSVNLSLLKEIHISLETAKTQGTWYLDRVIVDIVSLPTPDQYLSEYEWNLNRLLDHRNETLKMVLAGWGASNDSQADQDTYRFDITLPTFTEAYKITGNITYLTAARESFNKAITYLYNPTTHLFSTEWNFSSETYVDRLYILWGAITLNGMFDLYDVTLNSTYLTYANLYAEDLHTYGINSTTNLPHHSISVTNGSIITRDAEVPMETGRLIGAYIKGYEVSSIVKYKTWAKDLAQAFWAKRNATTDLVPLCIDSNGSILADFCKPNYDPIQNVLLHAYEVTKDRFYLSLAINLTDAQLTSTWSKSLCRTVRSVWTNGSVRDSILDLTEGPQLYIVGLLQLYHYTSNSAYLTYAETMWNTIHGNALVNHLYITRLDARNNPYGVSNLYTQQMMVQCNAYLFYFTKNQTYLDDVKNTVNNFLLYFKMYYGFCHSINMTSYEPIFDSTFDWLDSTSYTLGAAIHVYSVYSMQTTTTVEADITYYVPYYPMFRIRGSLNYTNNRIDFNARGVSSYLHLILIFPQGKVINTVATNRSSIFFYVENPSHVLICDTGSYSVTITMTQGVLQKIFVKTFDFADERLTVTFNTIKNDNVTLKVRIPFNETSQTPFPNDAWDVICTESQWGKSWNSTSRMLMVWAISDGLTTIIVLNLPPDAVVLYNPLDISDASMKLNWTESADMDFAKYEVYQSTSLGNLGMVIYDITEKSVTYYTVSDLLPNTTYYFIVRVVDRGGLFADSNQVGGKTKVRPSAVVLNGPLDISDASMKLNWTESADMDFAKYEVYQSTAQGILGTLIHNITERSDTSYIVTGLFPNTTYYFTIRVVDTEGLFADSNQVSGKTKSPTVFPWIPLSIILVVIIATALVLIVRRKVGSRALGGCQK